MDIMRELTDNELESVTGGLAAAAAAAGSNSATALSTNTAGFLQAIGFNGENITTMAGVIGAQAAATAN
jgi:lactobin A/cerein 7B family class IIb bacteriocin